MRPRPSTSAGPANAVPSSVVASAKPPPFGAAITSCVRTFGVPDHVHWAHCDIAGPAIQTGGWRYSAKGMTGFATRTLARLASRL